MNRWFGGDASLNARIREVGDTGPAPSRHTSFQFSPVVEKLVDGSVTIGTFCRYRTTKVAPRAGG